MSTQIQNTHSDYSCHKCGATFQTRFELDFHVQNVHPVVHLPFTCSECGEGFESQNELDDHIQVEHYSDIYTKFPVLKWFTVPFPRISTIAFIILMIFCHDSGLRAILGAFLICCMFFGGIISPPLSIHPRFEGVSVILKIVETVILPIIASIYLMLFS